MFPGEHYVVTLLLTRSYKNKMLKKALKFRLRNNRAGLTLVEILISAVILSIAIAGSYGASTFAWKAIQRSEGRSMVLNYARLTHEQLRSLGYNASPEMDIGTHDSASGNMGSIDIAADHPLKTRYDAELSWTVSWGPGTYGDDQRYKEVVVAIDWTPPTT